MSTTTRSRCTAGVIEICVAEGGTVTLVLDPSFDSERGKIDLTDAVCDLVALGLDRPYEAPTAGVVFGAVETTGVVTASCAGRQLSDDVLLRAIGDGFIQAVINGIAATASPAPDSGDQAAEA
jgi:hypothetical protein